MPRTSDSPTNRRRRAGVRIVGSCCSLIAAATAVGGCGGSSAPARAQARAGPQKPSVEYVVRMTGTAESPPTRGVGDAIVALHDGAREICYRFAHLRGFPETSNALIRRDTIGQTGTAVVSLATGPRLRHRGCVPVSATVMSAITAHPSAYVVEIQSVPDHRGLVRAAL